MDCDGNLSVLDETDVEKKWLRRDEQYISVGTPRFSGNRYCFFYGLIECLTTKELKNQKPTKKKDQTENIVLESNHRVCTHMFIYAYDVYSVLSGEYNMYFVCTVYGHTGVPRRRYVYWI
jgi:hypothetical protein